MRSQHSLSAVFLAAHQVFRHTSVEMVIHTNFTTYLELGTQAVVPLQLSR